MSKDNHIYDRVPRAADLFDDPEAVEDDEDEYAPPRGQGEQVEAETWRDDQDDDVEPRERNEYRTGGHLSDGTPFSELALPEHYGGNHGRSKSVISSGWGDRPDWDDDGTGQQSSPWSSHDADKHLAFDLLFIANDGEGFHVIQRTGERPGPRRVRSAATLEEQLTDLLAAVGYGSILEATSTTGNGRKADEAIMRAFAALAERGSYAEIHRLFGPSKNTLTKWRQIVEGLPPV